MNTRLILIAGAICIAMALNVPGVQAASLSKDGSVRILAMGDSITEGKFLTTGGYRKPLRDLLITAGYNIVYVGKEDNGDPANDTGFAKDMQNPNHEGYGSIRIDQLIKGGGAEGHSVLPIDQTITADKPDVILLMIGTNDLLQARDLHNVYDRLDALVAKIFAANKYVKLVLAQPTPMAGPRGSLSAVYGAGVPFVVDKYKASGFDITLADMFSALNVTDLGDGVHPNAIGYAKMANVWFQALTGIVPKPIESPVAAANPKPDVASSPASVAASGGAVPAIAGKLGALSFTGASKDGAGGPFCLGFKFMTGPADVSVTALGYLNDGATGDAATHSVGIYDESTKQLVTPETLVTTTGGDLTGAQASFSYIKLAAPVKLTANTTYVIAGTMMRTGFLKHESGLALSDGIVPSSVVAVYEASHTLAFPSHTIASNGAGNIGPNFLTATTSAR